MIRLPFFLLVFLLSLAGCRENSSDKPPTVNRPPDDYRKNNSSPSLATRPAKESGEQDNTAAALGWPQRERDDFVTECVKSAMKKGVTQARADQYCRCMGENLERLYPDINELASLSAQRLEEVMEPFRKSCLGEE